MCVPYSSTRRENACLGHTSRHRCNACPQAILQEHDGLQNGIDVSMPDVLIPMTQAGRQARKHTRTEGTFWRCRGLVWPSPWGSYRVRQGRGIIVIACIGAPCPCRPVAHRPELASYHCWSPPCKAVVLQTQQYVSADTCTAQKLHSSMFQQILVYAQKLY